MFKSFKNLFGIFLILSVLASLAYSAAPSIISYQGMLKDSNGDPVNGQFSFVVAIYDDSISTDPSHMLWQETHLGIDVVDGLYQLTLGGGLPPVPLTDAAFAGPDRWIGVRVQGGVELVPRTRICSNAYSQRVQTIDGTSGGVITGNTDIQGAVRSVVDGIEFFMVPRGAIIMWSGTLASIPSGWALCNGSNGTPDLRNRFIYSCDFDEEPGATGGSITHDHTVDLPYTPMGPPSAAAYVPGGVPYHFVADGAHGHALDPDPVQSLAGSTLPPYYKLAFIMKL